MDGDRDRDPHWSTGLSFQGPNEEQKEEEHEQGSQYHEGVSSFPDALQKWNDFFQALKVNESLTCPDLTDNKLWAKGAKLLCKTWKQPKSKLQRMSLENCHLTGSCCKDLSSILMVSQTPTHFSLAKNNLENGEVKTLCESLRYPECKLQTLVLRSCSITSEGCCHLSKMLREALHLEHLDLGLNHIGSEDVRLLCNALKEPQSNLKSLWLKFDNTNPRTQNLIQEMKASHPQLTINSDQPDPKKKESSFLHFIF